MYDYYLGCSRNASSFKSRLWVYERNQDAHECSPRSLSLPPFKQKKVLELPLKSLKNLSFGREFHPLLMIRIVKEHSSGVWTPKFGELKRWCLILAKRQLAKNGHLIKKIESTILGAFKSLSWSSLLYTHLLAKVKRLCLYLTKLGVPIPLEHSLNILSCQKWGETPYQNTRITLLD